MHSIRVDLYDIAAVERALAQIAADYPVVDVIVNNAHELGPRTGFNVPEGHLQDATSDGWMRNLTGGVYWAALITQRIGLGMKNRGKGSIVNISTMYAVVAPSPHLYAGTDFMNPPGYSASKAALLAFTRYTASFWGPFGVRANAILPGHSLIRNRTRRTASRQTIRFSSALNRERPWGVRVRRANWWERCCIWLRTHRASPPARR